VGKGLLVLLDGLDEVSSRLYTKMETAINSLSSILSEKSENNAIILTMRMQFHQQVRRAYSSSFPNVVEIKRFSPSDIFKFLENWFKDGDTRNIARIYTDLTDRPTLREMCTNPLVLSMYVAEDQVSGHALSPESRTEFYSKVIEELLIKRRSKQTGPKK